MNWMMLRHAGFITATTILLISAGMLMLGVRALGLHVTKLPIYPESDLQLHSLHDTRSIELEGWERLGTDETMSPEAEEELGTGNYLSRYYRQTNPPEGREPVVVQLHLAYYTGMLDTVPHVPDRCLVGAGFVQIGGSSIVRIPVKVEGWLVSEDVPDWKAPGKTVRMWKGRSLETQGRVFMPRDIENLRMKVQQFQTPDGQRLWAGYFFLANGGVVATADELRMLAFKITDDYAYYCKVQFTVIGVENETEFADVAASMLDQILPDIMRRVPNWVDVMEGRWPVRAAR